ncbi:hypothetical protein GCM10008179_13560 [Hansschlegelia plantiphila]|uniref:DUF2093 domain-containing protein n=2 Tax=Hansschlegelia plantiphila TaxID=374655 RepID=A0A9W6J1L4_9HYPH|nr:hypothetical protein GCM10008179_13560 [Hansschlegelia plantiphila]
MSDARARTEQPILDCRQERLNRALFASSRSDAYMEAGPETLEPMNRYERPPSSEEAELRYLDADFRVIRPGGFVRCAVTGAKIPLEELRYWSVERQEAYSGPDAALTRALGKG